MTKLDFSTYQKQYNHIMRKEKRTAKKKKKIKAKLEAREMYGETLKTYQSLKEELNNIKNQITLSVSNKEDILNDINKNEEHINGLITSLKIHKNDLMKSKSNFFLDLMLDFNILDLFNIILLITLYMSLGFVCGIMINLINGLIFSINFLFSNVIMWGFISSIILDIIFSKMEDNRSIIESFYQFVISMLPIHNKYSFVKLIKQLENLKQDYHELKQKYENYTKYVTEDNSDVKKYEPPKEKIEDGYLLEIAKLINKINKIMNLEDRKKFMTTLTKVTETYKQELEKIILQHGSNHSNDEINLKNNIIKQLAYLELQVDQILYKERKIGILNEDYATTMAIIENGEGRKLLKR